MSGLRTLLLSASLLLPCLAQADVLVIEHARQSTSQEKPHNGLTMAEVESRYGAPWKCALPWASRPSRNGSTRATWSTLNTTGSFTP